MDGSTDDEGKVQPAPEPSRRDMQLKDEGGAGRIWRVLRFFAVLGGIAAVLGGVVMAIQYMQTPEILLDHQKPPTEAELRAISPYANAYGGGTAPNGQRVGLWVEIPALKIYLPIKEGDNSNSIKIPDWTAFHYPGTAMPGAYGNSYIYAHGTWGRFGALLLAKDGEEVNLHNYNDGSVQTFHISQVVGKIKWNDVSYMQKTTPYPELTLQTCVGANYYTDRWIVIAT